jgi:mutator protein MutT
VVVLHNERDEWELPGGRLEAGETPQECVAREVREELGIDVVVDRIIDAWVYPVRPDSAVLVVTYGCEPLGPTTVVVSDEHDQVALVAPDELGSLLMPDGYRVSIKRWLAESRNRPDPGDV